MSAPSSPIDVLHVDEDPEFADRSAARLEAEDERLVVETATSGAEALDCLSAGGPDCIVSGYDLPDATGIDLLESVREDLPNFPFILFTGAGSESVASRAISADVTDYLEKGVDADQYALLANRITNAVEQVRAEQARQRSEARFRALTENTSLVVITIDETSIVEYVNDAIEDVLGYDPEALRGGSLSKIIPDRLEAEHFAGIERYLATGDRNMDWTGVELTGQHADGHEVPLALSFGETSVGGDHYFTAVIRDISDRKERERELERTNERLEEFASVVSHDLRNPLTVAEGHLAAARQDCDSEHLDELAISLSRMNDIIDDTLTLAKQGELVDDLEPVEIPSLVEDCWDQVATDGASEEVLDDLVVRADDARMQHVFENLFRNSVEHGSTGNRPRVGDADEHEGGGVTVRVGALEEGDGFFVEDDGTGIPEEHHDQVFQPGYSTAEDGTGFGLAIVQEIVEAHGWRIDVTENDDGGARFEVRGVQSLTRQDAGGTASD